MSPQQCIAHLEQLNTTLGADGVAKLREQIESLQPKIGGMIEKGALADLVSIPAAEAAAIVLKELRRQYPHSPIARWNVKDQLRAAYTLLACGMEHFFKGGRINFASDLEVEHLVGSREFD